MRLAITGVGSANTSCSSAARVAARPLGLTRDQGSLEWSSSCRSSTAAMMRTGSGCAPAGRHDSSPCTTASVFACSASR